MGADDVLALERSGWEALATSGEAAGEFYERVLADSVLMLLPGGLVLDDRAAILASMSGDPWDGYSLEGERVHRVCDGVAVVAYRAKARRGELSYDALVASTYVHHDGSWRLSVHQQTPVG